MVSTTRFVGGLEIIETIQGACGLTHFHSSPLKSPLVSKRMTRIEFVVGETRWILIVAIVRLATVVIGTRCGRVC